jgi:hypothetical protein
MSDVGGVLDVGGMSDVGVTKDCRLTKKNWSEPPGFFPAG